MTETFTERHAKLTVPTFYIDSAAAARRFQSLLNAYYVRSRLTEDPHAVPADLFATVYEFARTHRQDGRLLWAVIDLELTYLSMMRDVHGAAGVWNVRFNPASPKPASVLDDPYAFAGKLDILHNMTSFALRCRAFWDKAMGILFLLYDNSSYEAFTQSSRRKRFFNKRASSWPSLSSHLLKSLDKVDVVDLATQPGLPDRAISPPYSPRVASNPPFHEHLTQIIDTLDNKVRTAESHGAGTLRKWSFAMLPLHESKDAWLFNHWNIATGFTHALHRTLLDLDEPA